MGISVPAYLTGFVSVVTLATVGAVLFGADRALRLAKWRDPDRRKGVVIVGAALVGTLIATLVPSWLGLYQAQSLGQPTIQYGVLLPLVVGLVMWRWGTVRRVVEAIPQRWMVSVQFYRALGFIFLVLYAQGRMPGAFALPAGIGDVVVGLAAPIVGAAYGRSPHRAAGWVRAWNWFGITDLVVALTTGFLTSPSPLQRLALDAPNTLIGAFPLVIIPVFLVPLSLLLHFASLRKLGKAESAVVGGNFAAVRS